MSLTGFLFGNVDEDGNISDDELANELRDTLGGGDDTGGDYLSGILGSSLFLDTIEKSADSGEAPTPSRGSPEIKPAKDAVDFSDFNELAEDAAVPSRWNQQEQISSSLKYGSTIERAQVDEDYDDDDDEDVEDDSMVVGAEVIHTAAAHDIEAQEAGTDSDEEHLEDLFDSPIKPDSTSSGLVDGPSGGKRLDFSGLESADATQQTDSLEYAPDTPAEVPQLSTVATVQVKRPVKRISPGNIKFTDYFGSQIVRNVKKPRREPPAREDADSDDEFHAGLQLPLVQQPALDTRTMLLSADDTRGDERPDQFLRSVLARSMAADDRSDVYITIDARTGAVASQTVRPKHKKDTAAELFEKVPYPLDIDDWENQVIWQDTGDEPECDKEADAGQEKKTEQKQENLARDLVAMPKNQLLEDFETHIIWDSDTPFQSYSQLQINLNDTHMLFEDANVIKESNAREAERQRILEGVDRFNLSNDHFYEALQGGQTHRVRQTFGQLIVAHSLPSLRLQQPYFKMRHTRQDMRSWHRPCLQVPVGTEIQFGRVRSAKKRKEKHSMENPWAAKDVTLKDSADCVLIEYSEEYPLVLSNVGMGSVFVNYYRKRSALDQAFPKVDLGELMILDLADISPFLNFGNIEPGQVVPALYNNMFRAPLFQQKQRATDFLVVKHVAKGEAKWFVRNIKYQYVVGQTYPLQEVPAPHSRKVTTTVKHRLQVAAYRIMNRNQYHLLQMAKLTRLFPEYSELQIRQRLKEFCEYQRKGLGAGYWRPKHTMPIPDEDNLRKMLTPEMLCLYESMRVCQQQLHDAGKLNDGSEEDGADDQGDSKLSIEEILATWNLTRNFINATQGKAMLKLHGEGDPTGCGEGFSFVRVSMKDIFLRAGESVEEKLAEIEARPKSAHRYNVAEQQQIYKEEITSIWNKQFRTLTRPVAETRPPTDANRDENVIVPVINDMFGDSGIGQDDLTAIDPTRMPAGSAMDVSLKMARGTMSEQQQQTTTVHANCVQPNRKGLVIRRAVRSPYTGELMWKTEVVRDQAVIQAYLRQRRIIENLAHRGAGLFDSEADVVGETQAQVGRLKWARERRAAEAREHEKSHMTTFSLPQPNKPKKEVVRRCGNCNQLGHMKTNKKCPRYYEFNPV
ncbi:hypothetical protein LPJ53_004048 [Coemansia erecta]|uniref:Transcription initiation factor TFIID subunit 1 histone acetyltransferase domain-containing protein n=1 Tax=Coemansia erecta TaxID=147472 RepID=A0A9W7XZW5_9FUNG|nr:hypothetical protein LPJ53_004048 [Coemansia erecta]